jgi:hypothetical protein
MIRIKCKTPSTGRTVNFAISGIGTDWQTLVEAPDFSVPDASNLFAQRDPADDGRAIRPGEIFFITPMFARNTSAADCWIEVQLVQENGTVVMCPGRMTVPAGDTALVPIQGRSIVKRAGGADLGDQIQIRAQTAASIDLWATAEEKPSSEHIGIIT